MPNEKLLDLVDITKDYAGTRALDAVSFDLNSSEVHCLVGENGAGKSTLIKILSGAVTPTKGEIILKNKEYSQLTPRNSINLGIATIYQDFDLVQTLTVTDNIFLGDEIQTPYKTIDKKKQVKEVNELLDRLHLNFDAKTMVSDLSPAQKQMLQLAKALHRDASIIIMDEPTASLGYEETQALMELIRNIIKEGNIAIIYISHFLNEVFEIGDRITVLKDGKKVATHIKGEIESEQIIKEMVGRAPSMFYQKEKAQIGETMFKVEDFTWGDYVKHVSFEVHSKEIFGIGGLVGAGRTELAMLLFGAERADSGRLELNGKDVTSTSPRAAIFKGISMISENRQEEGIFLIRPIKENIAVVKTEMGNVLVNLKAEGSLVRKMMDRFNIKGSQSQDVGELSGGNQQKVIMSRWLLSDAEVYIFDEPTKGVDIGAKEEIYSFMSELAKQGKALIMISSDMPELLSMSDRIGIMRNGEMFKIINAEGTDEPKLLKDFLGIETT